MFVDHNDAKWRFQRSIYMISGIEIYVFHIPKWCRHKRLWHDISCVWLWKRIVQCQFHTTVCNFVDNIFAFFQFSFFYYGPFILYVYISDLYSALHTTPSCFLRGKFLRRLVCGWRATVLYIALLLTCSLHPCDACTSPHPKHWFCVICVQCVLLEWVFQWNCLPSSSLQG